MRTLHRGTTCQESNLDERFNKGHTVFLKVDEEFWAFEVARRNADIIFSAGVVEFSETPVDESEGAFIVVNHDVMRFNITMRDPFGMAIIERLDR